MNINDLCISKEHIIECVKKHNAHFLISQNWEVFKVFNSKFNYCVKFKRKCTPDVIADLRELGRLNEVENGYIYMIIHVDISITRDYLFLKSKGYDVDAVLNYT